MITGTHPEMTDLVSQRERLLRGNKLEAALGTHCPAPVEPKQLRDLHIDLRVPKKDQTT